jgi:hypothetical protein
MEKLMEVGYWFGVADGGFVTCPPVGKVVGAEEGKLTVTGEDVISWVVDHSGVGTMEGAMLVGFEEARVETGASVDGLRVGASEGKKLGICVGTTEGVKLVGFKETGVETGASEDGLRVGASVGRKLTIIGAMLVKAGTETGASVDGLRVGASVGRKLGICVGTMEGVMLVGFEEAGVKTGASVEGLLGAYVGKSVGLSVGIKDGTAVEGNPVGIFVNPATAGVTVVGDTLDLLLVGASVTGLALGMLQKYVTKQLQW